MAAAETARLIASLELKDKFSPGIAKAMGSLGGLEGRMNRIGGLAQQGVSNAIGNIARIGVVVGAGLGVAIKTGLDDLATLESATTSVDGAIKQLGLTGQLTGTQVAKWANEIEADIGAAFDDKAIVAASTTLLRFGKVTPANLRQTLVVMTDLATKTGSVESAAALLAKALADPEKAAGKLARSGVILTKQQQAQIKALVDAGDAAKAQAMLLDLLAKSTTGAANASQGPYKRALSVLSDVSEDARKALAEGFLPVLEKVAGKLSKGLADPKVMAQIREFGQGLAGALDSLIAIADKLPWGTIGDSLKIAGAGARTILEAFTNLPPWVQTAVITGWGLNKLTGGALGGIVGELGKGLIKGVLGMQAGVVNITAGSVNGAGIGGAAAASGAGRMASLAATAAKVFLVGAAAGAFLELKGIFDEQSARNQAQAGDLTTQTTVFAGKAPIADLASAIRGISATQDKLNKELSGAGLAFQLDIDGVRTAIESQKAILVDKLSRSERSVPTTNVAVTVNVTAAQIGKSVTIQRRFGPSGGSRERGATEFD